MQQRPDLLDLRAVLRPVKAWPGNTGASGNVIATASLDHPCARRTFAPAGRDEGTAARHEQRNSMKQGDVDDLASRELPAEVCERMRRRWSNRSSRRVRTLVTQLAHSRLIRESDRMRADIHDGPEQMLQSEAGYSNARPHQPGRRNLLHRTAGPYSWVIRDRGRTGGKSGHVRYAAEGGSKFRASV